MTVYEMNFVFQCNMEGPEGVKWELGFGQIFTGKVGFGSLGLGFGKSGNGNHRQKNNRTGTGIFKIWKNNRPGNGTWAKFGLGEWDLYPPPLQDSQHAFSCHAFLRSLRFSSPGH